MTGINMQCHRQNKMLSHGPNRAQVTLMGIVLAGLFAVCASVVHASERLLARACVAEDVPGYWRMQDQNVLTKLPPESTYAWPAQLLFIDASGTLVELRRKSGPISHTDIDAASRVSGTDRKEWAIDGPDGRMTIGPGSWNVYECMIAVTARSAGDFPTTVKKGDLLLLWKNPETQETLGTRLYRKLNPAAVTERGKLENSVASLTPAAERGDLSAQVRLASYYETRREWRNAVFWTRRAALQDYAPGQYALAFGRGDCRKMSRRLLSGC